MLQCPNCIQVQEKGKFCGKCGTRLQAITAESGEEAEVTKAVSAAEKISEKESGTQPMIQQAAVQESVQAMSEGTAVQHTVQDPAMQQAAATQAAPVEEGERLKEYKEDAKAYWGFLLELLKNPVKAFQFSERSFMFGLVNIILYLGSFVATVYFSVTSYLKSSPLMIMGEMFGMDSGAILQYLLMPTLLFVTMFVGLALIILYVFEKIFVKQMSIRHLIAQYGSLLTPLLALHVVSLAAGLMGSIVAALVLLGISLSYSTHILTAVFIFEKMTFYQAQEQRIYITMGMTFSILVVTYIFGRMTVFNMFAEFIEELFDMFSYF